MTDTFDAAHLGDEIASDALHATDGQGWYLYGITWSGRLTAEDLNGDSGPPNIGPLMTEPVKLVEEGGVAAIVRSVPLSEFDVETLQERSDDTAWLEAIVSLHNQVIADVHERQAVLPARFGSLYSSIQEVRQALVDAGGDLAAQLERLEGSDEWAAHIYADRSVVAERGDSDAAVRQLEEEIASARPGRAYFLQRKLEEERAAASRRSLAALAQKAYDALDPLAAAGQVSAPGRKSGRSVTETEILRAAFLVPRANVDRFLAELIALGNDEGVRTEYTGPWPPYSFVTLPETER